MTSPSSSSTGRPTESWRRWGSVGVARGDRVALLAVPSARVRRAPRRDRPRGSGGHPAGNATDAAEAAGALGEATPTLLLHDADLAQIAIGHGVPALDISTFLAGAPAVAPGARAAAILPRGGAADPDPDPDPTQTSIPTQTSTPTPTRPRSRCSPRERPAGRGRRCSRIAPSRRAPRPGRRPSRRRRAGSSASASPTLPGWASPGAPSAAGCPSTWLPASSPRPPLPSSAAPRRRATSRSCRSSLPACWRRPPPRLREMRRSTPPHRPPCAPSSWAGPRSRPTSCAGRPRPAGR